MNGSSTDIDFIRAKPKSFDPKRPMRLAVEAELRRQYQSLVKKGFMGASLSSDAEASPTARMVMILNLDDLATAVIAHHLNQKD